MKMVFITYANSEGSGEAAHPRSLARAFAVRPHNNSYGTRGSFKQRTGDLAPLDSCECASQRTQTTQCYSPFSHELAQIVFKLNKALILII